MSARSRDPRRFQRLLDDLDRDAPIFRMGFDAHVRRWSKAIQRETWEAYHTVPEFAAAYDKRRAELRALPLPPMGQAQPDQVPA